MNSRWLCPRIATQWVLALLKVLSGPSPVSVPVVGEGRGGGAAGLHTRAGQATFLCLGFIF